MTSPMTPLAANRDTTVDQRLAPSSGASSTKNPARGIVMGAALSAPLWLGITYLVRLLINAL